MILALGMTTTPTYSSHAMKARAAIEPTGSLRYRARPTRQALMLSLLLALPGCQGNQTQPAAATKPSTQHTHESSAKPRAAVATTKPIPLPSYREIIARGDYGVSAHDYERFLDTNSRPEETTVDRGYKDLACSRLMEIYRPRWRKESLAEFDRWQRMGVREQTGRRLPDAELIQAWAPLLKQLIAVLACDGPGNGNAKEIPSWGFLSGAVVRFGSAEDEMVLLVGPIAYPAAFNSLRLGQKQRAGRAIKNHIVGPALSLAGMYAKRMKASRVGITVIYAVRDFSKDRDTGQAEAVTLVASVSDVERVSDLKVTVEAFVKTAEVFVREGSLSSSRIEPTLD